MTKTKAQFRAEAVERLRECCYLSPIDLMCAVVGFGHEPHTGEQWRDALIDLLTDDEPVNCKNDDSLQDSREKLEADIWAGCDHLTMAERGDVLVNVPLNRLYEWLDRQAAITERNWIRICAATTDANIELKRQIDELQSKVDNQRDTLKRFNEMFNLCEWTTDDDGHYTYMSGSEMHLRVAKAERKAENEREHRMKIQAERDEFETKLNEVTGNFDDAMSCKRKWRDRYYELQAKHELPYGVEWPKFEDGTPVNIGDEVMFNGYTNNVYEISFLTDDIKLGLAVDNRPKASIILHYGEKAKRPVQEDSIEHVLADLRGNGIDSIADRIKRLVK